jgi:hypothetical protein
MDTSGDVSDTGLDSGDSSLDGSDTEADGESDVRPLPPTVESGIEVEGDFEIVAGESSLVDPDREGVTLGGNLYVRENATLEIAGGVTVHGTIEMEAGSKIVGVSAGNDAISTAVRADKLVVVGTASAPVEMDGATLEIFMRVDRMEVEYAYFYDVNFFVENASGRPVIMTDTVHEGPSDQTGVFTVQGRNSNVSRLEHNRFAHPNVWVAGFTMRKNVMSVAQLIAASEASVNWGEVACAGSREDDPDLVFEDNAFMGYVAEDEVVAVSRHFGEVDLSGNYFEGGLPTWDGWIDDWDGSDAGCSDDLGAYGGPATFEPELESPPADVGPRADVTPE